MLLCLLGAVVGGAAGAGLVTWWLSRPTAPLLTDGPSLLPYLRVATPARVAVPYATPPVPGRFLLKLRQHPDTPPALVHSTHDGGEARRLYEQYGLTGAQVLEFWDGSDQRGERRA